MLFIVKGEIGMIPVKFEKLKIENLFLQLPPEIASSLKNKNQNLKFDLQKLEINSDPYLLKIAIIRALQNATKFGRSHTDITIQAAFDENSNLVLKIKNQGPQISQNILEKLLKPFMLDENVMNHSVGMGLGLTICQTLVKALAGQLKIINEPDGVSVEFRFKQP